MKKNSKLIIIISFIITLICLTACSSTKQIVKTPSETTDTSITSETSETISDNNSENTETSSESSSLSIDTKTSPKDTITLLFGGDVMAHTENYNISTYEKIWRDVKYIIQPADLAFANIESPVDTTKPAASYPSFNMTQKYLQAAIDAGFDVFSLCNNHTNDQYISGIKETIKTTSRLTANAEQNGNKIYFSGLKQTPESEFTYNIIEKNGWKILFLPVTELLNRPEGSTYVNYIKTDNVAREDFIKYAKKLKSQYACDLFIISVHTAEPEYTRNITDRQNKFYMDLLGAGADIIWANHAHIIKNRKVVVDTKINRDKLIMYANGNTISGQRRKPELTSKNPVGERDNTGDGLLYQVTLKKDDSGSIKIQKAEPIFITTYINTANEFVLKPLNQEFVDYLYDVPRTNWAKYIERRIKINEEATKDYIEWQ